MAAGPADPATDPSTGRGASSPGPRSSARADSLAASLVSSGSWSALCASVRGSAHVRDGRPNQDAVALAVLEGPNQGVVAAVADGHGGSAYVRSHLGARMAVEIALTLTTEAVTIVPPEAIVAAWRSAVHDHLARYPLSPHERAATGDDVMCAYGSTLLLAVADSTGARLLKLGDGDLLAVSGGSGTWSPLPSDARLVAGVTTSLCLPTAAADCVTTVLQDGSVDLLLLATDGYGAAFADPHWRDGVGNDMREAVAAHGLDAVSASLPGWLAESARTGGDDVSLALLVRGRGAGP